MEGYSFNAVNTKIRKPEDEGWFNMVANTKPYPCGRAWFDGKEFHFENKNIKWLELLVNGYDVYWLELKDNSYIDKIKGLHDKFCEANNL